MPLPRMGKPPYLKPHHVQNDDLIVILEKPYVKDAEESQFGRDRGYAVIKVARTDALYTWGMNGTTWDRCLDAFSDNENMWIGKQVKIKLQATNIRGEDKMVIYGVPVVAPKQSAIS